MTDVFSLAELVAIGQQLRDPNPNLTSQKDSAYVFARTLFAAAPNDPATVCLWAQHLATRHQNEDAIAVLQNALTQHSDHPQLLRCYYNVQRHQGDHAGAAKTLLQLFMNDSDAGKIAEYLSSIDKPRAVLGGGEHYYPGWLNFDIIPPDDRYIWFDARDALLLPDQSLDTVFSEHMIEHITYADGLRLAAEIFRVLKPGGRVRIATPDLARTCSVIDATPGSVQQNYIDFINKSFGSDHNNRASFVINNMFFTYNHAFVYDEITLHELFVRAGFTNITRHLPRHSPHAELNNLEMHHLLGHPWVEDFQTLVLEACKP